MQIGIQPYSYQKIQEIQNKNNDIPFDGKIKLESEKVKTSIKLIQEENKIGTKIDIYA